MKFGTNTVTYRGPQIWNLITGNIKNAPSLDISKNGIKKGEVKHTHVEYLKHKRETSNINRKFLPPVFLYSV